MQRSNRLQGMPLAELTWILGAGVVLALMSYRFIDFTPMPGLDPSWGSAMHFASRNGLEWGPDVDFAYGPLGYLAVQKLYYDQTAFLSLVYLELTRSLALGAVFVLSRRGLGAVAAFVLTLLFAATMLTPEVVLGSALSVAVAVRADRHRHARALLGGIAVLAALSVLVKVNVGATVGALGALAVLASPGTRRQRRNDLAFLAGSFLVAVLAFWLLAGQSLTSLPQHVRTSLDIVSGYAASMNLDDPLLASQYTLALLLALAGFLAIGMLDRTAFGGRPRVAAAAIWGATCFMQFKSGFVRHDAGHAAIFFTTVPLVLVVLAAHLRSRTAALALAVLPLTIMVATTNNRLDQLWSPLEGVEMAWDQATELADSEKREKRRNVGRDLIATQVGLSQALLDDVAGRGVYVHPEESSVVWAYALKWRPVPVFQSYQAYTDGIDEDNAKRLADPRRGPERVLVRSPGGIDGRYVPFDEPAVTRGMLCGFTPSVEDGPWISLARTRDRCGALVPLMTVKAGWDDPITVPAPAPGTAVVAKVDGVAVGGFERVRAALFKAHLRSVAFDGGQNFRLIPGTADGPLVLRATPGLDLPAPWSQIPQARTITFGKASTPSGGDDLSVSFFAMPFSAARAPEKRSGSAPRRPAR